MEAGAGARGRAAGAAKRTFVGLVTGDVHFKQGARRDIQFEAAAAAIDKRAGSDYETAFLFHHADGFASGAAGGPNILDDEDALAGFNFKAAAEGHLAGAVAFDEERSYAESACDFVADQNAAESRRHDASDGVFLEELGESTAEALGVLWMLQNEGALDVRAAVASAGELEMPGADGAYLFEKLENFAACHGYLPGAAA
jgi:hypothetical protein